MIRVVVAIVFALTACTGGVLYAADGAVPGEPLYGIDQAIESAQLRLTSEPQASVEVLLSFAEERVLEAEELSGRGDGEHLQIALSGYGTAISSLAEKLSTAEDLNGATLVAVVDQSFSDHEARLARTLRQAKEDGEDGDGGEGQEPDNQGETCVGTAPHPVAASLAVSYGVPYTAIMSWFCVDNYGFGEIVHALETSGELAAIGITEWTPADLLALKTSLGGWGLVWQELGLIGRPAGKPVGPSNHAGPPDDVPVGPPAHAGPKDQAGPKDNAPAGPPDHAGPKDNAGPKDDMPASPPDQAGPKDNAGPKDDTPAGPPDHAGPKDSAGPKDDMPTGPPDHAGPPEKEPGKPAKEDKSKKSP